MKTVMTQAKRIIAKFGNMSNLARALGHRNVTTVQGWAERGYIPPRQHAAVWAAAKATGIEMELSDFAAVNDEAA